PARLHFVDRRAGDDAGDLRPVAPKIRRRPAGDDGGRHRPLGVAAGHGLDASPARRALRAAALLLADAGAARGPAGRRRAAAPGRDAPLDTGRRPRPARGGAVLLETPRPAL